MDDRLHTLGVAMVVLAGVVAIANGAWFIVGQHPFDDDGYSEEVDLSREEARQVNPELEDWLLHVSDQTGSVTVGWGLFIVTLGLVGLPSSDRTAQIALLVGGLPTLLFSAFGEFVQFGTLDTGTVISMVVLVLFVLGLGLTARDLLPGEAGSAA